MPLIRRTHPTLVLVRLETLFLVRLLLPSGASFEETATNLGEAMLRAATLIRKHVRANERARLQLEGWDEPETCLPSNSR